MMLYIYSKKASLRACHRGFWFRDPGGPEGKAGKGVGIERESVMNHLLRSLYNI